MNLNRKTIGAIIGVSLIAVAAAVIIPAYASHRAAATAAASIDGKGTTDNPFAVATTAPIDVRIDPAIASQVAAAIVAQQPVKAAPATPKPSTPAKPKPAFKTVTKRVCEPKTVTVEVDVPDPVKPQERSAAGMLIGGAVGALLGNQVGGGNGKTLATVGGAAAGAFAGDRMANGNGQPAAQTFHKEQRQFVTEVCRDVEEKVRVN